MVCNVVYCMPVSLMWPDSVKNIISSCLYGQGAITPIAQVHSLSGGATSSALSHPIAVEALILLPQNVKKHSVPSIS
jgi:hypothetical protein